MGHVPDHTPSAAAPDHAALIVALDAGDLAGDERDLAAALAGSCSGCASLLADLALLRAATALLPAPPRSRDFRLTDADAERLRPSPWRRLVAWMGAPRSTVRPLAGGLAALGIAGLLLTTTPGLFGASAGSLTTADSAATVPADNQAAGAASEPSAAASAAAITLTGPATAPSVAAAPSAAASPAPVASPAASDTGATPPRVAVPAPSLAAAALPAPTPPPTANVGFGAAPAATAGPVASSNDARAIDVAPKAAQPGASQAERNALLAGSSERGASPPDRTPALLISLALIAAGAALFITNRVLRRHAGA
jgi:hypothetical protein